MIFFGIILPFIGTTLGALTVFLFKDNLKSTLERILLGFASGVMIAASIWSLLIPAMEMTNMPSFLKAIPAGIGFMLGVFFLAILDRIIPHLHPNTTHVEGIKVKHQVKKTKMMVIAVTLHNIPEGIALGVVMAGVLLHNPLLTISSALTLSLGISIQNFPEGAIVSLPLKAEGMSKKKAFLVGTISGIVEPISATITLVLANFVTPILPYLLSFAAGAMIYVVAEELIPEAKKNEHTDIGTLSLAVGFLLMMILDVTFS